MKRFTFNVDFTGHTFVEIEAEDLDSAKEEVQAELEMNIIGTLDSYHITSTKEQDL